MLPFWESGIWICARGRGCLCDQPSINTLCTESVMCFLGWQHFTHGVTTPFWKNCMCSVCLHWERTLETCAWFPQGSASCSFAPHGFCFVYF